ncbi:hypothetical protein F5Y17DRAFT_459733 [Xylariaceae sp. FL0594]|nr:hypothetical protein F5Y17DRAFT_459733 [Xylariaceae sp. FL0594]
MALPVQMNNTHSGVRYTPTSDALDRHKFGVSKSRKSKSEKLASTGGGRAWSEDEEVYLLRTRRQKVQYKYIAEHLNKTALACRLHYYQLRHGTNRRKRATSVSSGSSSGLSPVLPAINPSSVQVPSSRDATTRESVGMREPSSPDRDQSLVLLPRIMPRTSVSPRLPALLPKPASIALSTNQTSSGLNYPMHKDLTDNSIHSLAPPAFSKSTTAGQTPSLRLDCSVALPPPSASQVDLSRLQAIYASHRSTFWGAIAADYGSGTSPNVLEHAWKTNSISLTPSGGGHAPITPAPSPNDRESSLGLGLGPPVSYDKTRISALLGIGSSVVDTAHPRVTQEKELAARRSSTVEQGVTVPSAT